MRFWWAQNGLFDVFFTTKNTTFVVFCLKYGCGGAAGYCLRVRVITGIQFYIHSFLFRFGGYLKLQETKLGDAVAFVFVLWCAAP